MNRVGIVWCLLVGLGGGGLAFADDGLDMAKRDHCTACHRVDRKLIGPAYLDVAKRYAGDASAEARLTKKVKLGGAGVWGDVPMPPNDAVSDEDIKALVEWVLQLKPVAATAPNDATK